MTRVTLACLLLLVACKPKDPEGTLQPGALGSINIPELAIGDSPPFRWAGGDIHVFVMPAAKAPNFDSMSDCRPSFALIKYGEQQGIEMNIGNVPVGETRVNGVASGLYFIRLNAAYNFCEYSVAVEKPK